MKLKNNREQKEELQNPTKSVFFYLRHAYITSLCTQYILHQYFEAHTKNEGIPIGRYVTRLPGMAQGNAKDEAVPYSWADNKART